MTFDMYVSALNVDADEQRRLSEAIDGATTTSEEPFNASKVYPEGSDGWLRVTLPNVMFGIDAMDIAIVRPFQDSPNVSVVVVSQDCNALTTSTSAIARIDDMSVALNTSIPMVVTKKPVSSGNPMMSRPTPCYTRPFCVPCISVAYAFESCVLDAVGDG